jgi:hypothetical protein
MLTRRFTYLDGRQREIYPRCVKVPGISKIKVKKVEKIK